MGFVTTALLHIVAAFEWRDPFRSVFQPGDDRQRAVRLLMVAAVVLTFLATTIGGLQLILDTTQLDGHQWRAWLVAVLGFLVLAEREAARCRFSTRGPAHDHDPVEPDAAGVVVRPSSTPAK